MKLVSYLTPFLVPLIPLLQFTPALSTLAAHKLAASPPQNASPPAPKNKTAAGVLRLIGPTSIGHGCLVDGVPYTARHATDDIYNFEDLSGVAGQFEITMRHPGADVAFGMLSRRLSTNPDPNPESATYATFTPQAGEEVFWYEYDMSSPDHFFRPLRRQSRIVQVLAGHIFIKDPPQDGASGSCVFNSAGGVIGMIVKRLEASNGENVGMAVQFVVDKEVQ